MESQAEKEPRRRRRRSDVIDSESRQSNHKDKCIPCTQCDWAFETYSQRKIHLRQAHGIGSLLPHIYKCEMCDYRGPSKARVSQHMRVHSEDRPYPCTYPGCKYRTKHPRNLKDHLPRHDPDLSARFKCKLCPKKSFPHWYQLERHLRSHTKEAYKKCSECDFKAVNITGLISHRKICHSRGHPKKWPAPKYPVADSAEILIDYMEMLDHDRTSKYKCLFPGCEYVTRIESCAKAHIRLHKPPSAVKWYKCNFPDCGYETRATASFRSHCKTHDPDRKRHLQCSVCPKKFLGHDGLRRHLRTHGNEVCCCLFCDYEAVESCNVYRHMKMYHGDLWRRGMKLEKRIRNSTSDTTVKFDRETEHRRLRVVVSGRRVVNRPIVGSGPVVILKRVKIVAQ